MTQLDMDLVAAAERRDEGMQRAVEHADRVEDGWSESAGAFLRRFAQTHIEFLAEDVITASRGQVPEPPDGRAWGAVFRRAASGKVIQKAGYRPAKSSNLSPKVFWASLVLDLSQPMDEREWCRLARDYVRAYRVNIRSEGFITDDVIRYAETLGCPTPPKGANWTAALEADGMRWSIERRGWHVPAPEPCCAGCAEKH